MSSNTLKFTLSDGSKISYSGTNPAKFVQNLVDMGLIKASEGLASRTEPLLKSKSHQEGWVRKVENRTLQQPAFSGFDYSIVQDPQTMIKNANRGNVPDWGNK